MPDEDGRAAAAWIARPTSVTGRLVASMPLTDRCRTRVAFRWTRPAPIRLPRGVRRCGRFRRQIAQDHAGQARLGRRPDVRVRVALQGPPQRPGDGRLLLRAEKLTQGRGDRRPVPRRRALRQGRRQRPDGERSPIALICPSRPRRRSPRSSSPSSKAQPADRRPDHVATAVPRGSVSSSSMGMPLLVVAEMTRRLSPIFERPDLLPYGKPARARDRPARTPAPVPLRLGTRLGRRRRTAAARPRPPAALDLVGRHASRARGSGPGHCRVRARKLGLVVAAGDVEVPLDLLPPTRSTNADARDAAWWRHQGVPDGRQQVGVRPATVPG